jgi:hypothetical protein
MESGNAHQQGGAMKASLRIKKGCLGCGNAISHAEDIIALRNISAHLHKDDK